MHPNRASDPIMECTGIRRRLGGREVLSIDRLGICPGTIHAVTGPNGSGKTTLLRLMAFLDRPDEGSIRYAGSIVDTRREGRELRKRVTLVLQNPFLLRSTVFSNVAAGLRVRRWDRSRIKNRVQEALNQVGLDGFENRRGVELSSGEVQRVAIARALALEPEILLLDEPLANIDSASMNAIEALMRDLVHVKQSTIVYSTHDVTRALALTNRMTSLIDGKVAPSTVENLFDVEIEEGTGGVARACYGACVLEITTDKRGAARLMIPPELIIVTTRAYPSSARNRLKGIVTRLTQAGEKVDLVVDAGMPLTVRITSTSVKEMGIRLGATVYLNFKATAIQVL